MSGRHPGHGVVRLAAALLMALALVPASQALVLEDPVHLVVHGSIVAPPGEDLVLRAPHIILDHAELRAGDGTMGASGSAEGLAVGQDGGNGGSIVLDGAVTCIDSILTPGSGGRGGDATAWGTSIHQDAEAHGGAGGDAGQVIGHATGCRVATARAGDGGSAQASGNQASCAGGKGADAGVDHSNDTTTVGPGLDADARASEGGPGALCGGPNVSDGGPGGNASAYGGPGGIRGSDAEGANGGNATAIAGTGGRGGGLCTSDAATFTFSWDNGLRKAGNGGPGGKAYAIGGKGGTGVTTGGDGGRAVASSQGGAGGAGSRLGDDTIAPGVAGDVLPGTEAHGGAGGMGLSGGTGGKASAITLKGANGTLCTVGAAVSGGASSSMAASPGSSSSTDSSTAADKGAPSLALPLILAALAVALVVLRRR